MEIRACRIQGSLLHNLAPACSTECEPWKYITLVLKGWLSKHPIILMQLQSVFWGMVFF